MIDHILTHLSLLRGYTGHADPETDSDGDGGVKPKLRGLNYIERSTKGIPHGVVHYPEMVKWAGHMFMFDTCAPEASHKETIKEPMDRVRKLDERKTASAMMDWTLRKRTWCKIVTLVKSVFHPLKDEGKTPPPTEGKTPPPTYPTIHFSDRNIHTPVENGRSGLWDNTFSPLIQGGDSLLTPDVRVRTHLFIHVCFHMITYI